MVGYKLFRVDSNGYLTSCIVKGEAKVRYKEGKKNRPPKWLRDIGCNITFFPYLERAIGWKFLMGIFYGLNSCQVWKVRIQKVCSLPIKLETKDLADGITIRAKDSTWPIGTGMGEILIPIEKVDRNELRQYRRRLNR